MVSSPCVLRFSGPALLCWATGRGPRLRRATDALCSEACPRIKTTMRATGGRVKSLELTLLWSVVGQSARGREITFRENSYLSAKNSYLGTVSKSCKKRQKSRKDERNRR